MSSQKETITVNIDSLPDISILLLFDKRQAKIILIIKHTK
jgi:hypothetical protein